MNRSAEDMEPAVTQEIGAEQGDPGSDSPIHVLVVDDEQLTRELLGVQLRHLHYQVTDRASGMEALEFLNSHHVDMVLLDLEMPDVGGMVVLDQLRKSFSPLSLPVIMVTADDNEKTIIEALRKGANDYLVKPVNMEVADARIKTHLNMSRLLRLKDEFLGFASHDLKKPLMVIEDVVAELLSSLDKGQADPTEQRELLGLVARTNATMRDIVRGFLDENARRGTCLDVSVSQVDVNELIKNVSHMNRAYASRKGIDLSCKLDQSLGAIRTDAFRVTQVLENLVGNALKFSEQGTRVILRSEARENLVLVDIVDQGPGFRGDEIRHVFATGAQLSNRPTGGEDSTGIGLPLCRELMEQIGGDITVENNTDRGATFTIRIRNDRRK